MFIVSQNSTIIVCINKQCEILAEKNNVICADYIAKKKCILGVYKNKDRAEEVIKDLYHFMQSWISKFLLCGISEETQLPLSFGKDIYYMPKK